MQCADTSGESVPVMKTALQPNTTDLRWDAIEGAHVIHGGCEVPSFAFLMSESDCWFLCADLLI